MPLIGIGTYRMRDKYQIQEILTEGIEVGYRLIDTAQVYRNEEVIGGVIEEYLTNNKDKIERKDLFITSKIAPNNQGADRGYESTLETIKKLRLDYIDLMLIHWPGTSRISPQSPMNSEYRKQTYQSLERLYHEGIVKNIGISNYTLSHLKELLTYCQIKPQVLQIEYHPLYQSKEIIDYCKENGIQIQAYSSLGEGQLINDGDEFFKQFLKFNKNLLKENDIKGQLVGFLLKWAMLKNIVVIPKTNSVKHLISNFNYLNIDLNENINEFFNSCIYDSKYELKSNKFCWDPETVL
ncbi:Aldo/keto reductase [Neoconidiobolus thromboides FSU 785]|nr:Aldo/keto reductase [Neoconidiobolus thromboides FSU 785]